MVYRKTTNVVTRRIAGETILVPMKGRIADMDRVYVLHGAAEHIWELLDGRRTVVDLVTAVTDEFQVDVDRARADVDEFIRDLLGTGLIESGEET